MTIYFITGNKKKFEEAKSIMPEIEHLDISLVEIQSIDAREVITHKIKEALKHKQTELVVEDTSLYLSCLNGLPGPLIKWFIESLGNEGIFSIAEKLQNTKAEAKTIIGYAKDPNNIKFFEGAINGEIVRPSTASKFGWDPIFRPESNDKTFAEMTKEEKNSISMRKKAFEQLKEFISSKA